MRTAVPMPRTGEALAAAIWVAGFVTGIGAGLMLGRWVAKETFQ